LCHDIITFDNTSRIFNIDFDEVVLERAVHRDSVNEYLINGSQVRLRDIIELLASANIGASGHHIISQGEADRILNASIRERRSMIEDALGLKVYQYKREESERKLEKTAENIKQVESLRREIAPHIKFLEKQVEKVKRVESLREELIVLYREYLAREEKYLHTAKHALVERRKAPLAEFHEVEKKIEAAKKLIEETEGADIKAQEILVIEKELKNAEEMERAAQSRLSRLEGEKAALLRAFERAKHQVTQTSGGTVSLVELEALHQEIKNMGESGIAQNDPSFLRALISRLIDSLQHFINEKKQGGGVEQHTNDFEHDMAQLEKEYQTYAMQLEEATAVVKKKREAYEAFRHMREEEHSRGRLAERELFGLMNRRTELNTTLFRFKTEEEQIIREEEAFKAELSEAQALVGLAAIRYDSAGEEVLVEARVEQEQRRKKLEKMKIRLEEAGGAGGEEVKKEYEEVLERDQFLAREIEDLTSAKETLLELIAELQTKLEIEFKNGILKINNEFGNFFTLMFGGGSASLFVLTEKKLKRKNKDELIDFDGEIPEEDDTETEDGVDIQVSLPNKRVKGLSMLSGGERALTSIALLFAISQVNPPPFIILDETDAALDEANSRKYGDMIENLAKYSQLIVITHNRETMSRAGILYGVTMGAEGYSKLLSVKFDEAVQVAK
jgi:chromosome segregation protein